MAGDLRFPQIDAPATVNGYLGQVNPLFGAPAGFSLPAEYGTPLSVGVSCAGPTGVTGHTFYAFTGLIFPRV